MTLDRRGFLGALAGGAGLLTLGACGSGNSDPLSSAAPAGGASSAAGGSIVVGSADFTESMVLGEIYSQALVAKGVSSSVKSGIGSRERYITALKNGEIAAVPDYTGNLLLYFNQDATAKTAQQVLAALPKAAGSLKILAPSQASDQDVYVVTQETAQKYGLSSLADLTKVNNLTLGGPAEMPQRAYGPKGLKKDYGVTVSNFRSYSSLAVKVKDLKDGKVDVADFFTTDSAISENGFVQLKDPKNLILPQQVIPLVSAAVAGNDTAVSALNAVQKALTTDDLIALNKKVDNDHMDAGAVAKAWLASKSLG